MSSALPLSNLTDLHIRQSLTERFVIPLVCNARRQVCAFRVVWRPPVSDLETAWNNVGVHKETCDRIVAGISDVEFFFTAATGLYNKEQRQVDARSCVVYPAVSYYAVLKDKGDPTAVVNSLRAQVCGHFPDVHVKAILRRCPASCVNLADLAAPLFVALKDYNSSFVRKKVIEGLALMGRREQKDSFTVKLVVVNPDFNESVLDASEALVKDIPSLRMYMVLVPAKR